MEFECSGCGTCCRRVGQSVKAARAAVAKGSKDKQTIAVARFPYKAKEDGSCSKLGEDGKCEVYETRPTVCSVEKSFEAFAPKGMKKETYYEINGKLCNQWIRKAELDDKFLVKENYS